MIDNGIDLEPYGGDIPVIHISAKTGDNVDLLVELLLEESKRLNIKSDYKNQVEMQVIESYSNNEQELKKTSVVVKSGILRKGNYVIFSGRSVKIMNILDYQGKKIDFAEPGDIVKIEGIKDLPQSCETLIGVPDHKYCKVYRELCKNSEFFYKGKNQVTKNKNFKLHFKNYREKKSIFRS